MSAKSDVFKGFIVSNCLIVVFCFLVFFRFCLVYGVISLKYLKMEIKVFLNLNSEKPVFVRQVITNDAVTVDYACLLRSMRILFGSDCVVEFKIV